MSLLFGSVPLGILFVMDGQRYTCTLNLQISNIIKVYITLLQEVASYIIFSLHQHFWKYISLPLNLLNLHVVFCSTHDFTLSMHIIFMCSLVPTACVLPNIVQENAYKKGATGTRCYRVINTLLQINMNFIKSPVVLLEVFSLSLSHKFKPCFNFYICIIT